MSRRSRTSLLGLLARQSRANVGPLIAMAGVVLVVATLASTAPLALRSMTSAEVAYQFDNLPAVRRDLLSVAGGGPPISPGVAPYSMFESILADITTSAPEPLRQSLGKSTFVTTTNTFTVLRLGVKWNDPLTPITLNAATALEGNIRMTAGTLPGPFQQVIRPGNPWNRPPVDAFHRDPADPQIDIVMSTKSAKEAGWALGEERLIPLDKHQALYVKLTGTFDAIDPADGFWATARYTLNPGISATPFGGTDTRIVTSAAYVDPNSFAAVIAKGGWPLVTSVGIPFATDGLTVEEDEQLLPQLRRFLAQPQQVSNIVNSQALTVSSLKFNSDGDAALSTALTRTATTTSVLVMVASGPIGVAIAALWLLSRLIVLRRRDTLTLASTRGASGLQVRLSQAIELLLICVPAAAIGAIIAYLLYPASWTPLSAIVAGVVALVPPLLIGLAASPRSLRASRNDLDPGTRGRYRWILEIIVLALTALAVTLLLQRGLTSNSGTVVVDPLLAATPLLLAISAGLIVLRFYPLPLLGFARVARRRKGIVGFLGANRSIRDPAAGLAPVLAMVVGLAVAVFSGVLLGTVADGATTAAHSKVGADLRIDSPILTKEQLQDISAVEGVAESVSLYQFNKILNLTVKVRSSAETNIAVPVIVVDTAALSRVQSGVPGTARFTKDMSKPIDGRIPVILSPDLARQYTLTTDSMLDSVGVINGGDPRTSSSLSGTQDWVLIDVTNANAFEIHKFLPRITLVKLEPSADPAAVRAALSAIVGADSMIESPADAADAFIGSPIASGLQLALLALIVLVALLCATTIVLALMISGPSRERLLALLRTIGLTTRQARGITWWEIGPTSVVAIIAGLALGSVLPLIVLAGVDLRPFTGGVDQAAIHINPLLLSLIIGGFALLVITASAAAMVAARRVNLASTLRTSEEG